MRIVIIIPSLELGGAERSLIKLTEMINPIVERITVICFFSADEVLLRELPQGVDIVCLGAASSAAPLAWFQIYFRLRRLRPDLVIGWSTYANFVTVVVTRLLPKCKVILSERNYVPQMFSRTGTSPLRRYLILRLMRLLYRKADVVTANSRPNVKFLKKYIGKSPAYRLLPNVIDVMDMDRRADVLPVIPLLKKMESPRILALGRLCSQKGFDILLRAFALVHTTHPWSLVIVGEGSEKEALMLEAKALGLDRAVSWVGKVHNPFSYYRWADLVVVPSRYEGFPNVPLEAMASGRAVICSDCKTGPRELVVGGQNGVLVPVDDASALANAILELGTDPEKRARLGASARNHVLNTYDIEVMRQVYAQVLGLAK